MKKRIRKTGEIVDVISYTAPHGTTRFDTRDFVNYIDSKGKEHINVPMNIYWDFEDVEEVMSTSIDWEQVRINAAISALQGFSSNPHERCVNTDTGTLAKWSVGASDALIAELKKGGEK